jgi:hypothetical protein
MSKTLGRAGSAASTPGVKPASQKARIRTSRAGEQVAIEVVSFPVRKVVKDSPFSQIDPATGN